MALTGGLQYIDSLALRFSLHGLEDKFTGKPTFCLSWSEPFDLDSVAGKIVSNPKRSRSFPITLPKRIPENAEKENEVQKYGQRKDAKSFTSTRVGYNTKESCQVQHINKNAMTVITKPLTESRATSTLNNMEEESSDEELCDIMLEQKNIKLAHDMQGIRLQPEVLESRVVYDNSCDKKRHVNSRKRFLEEIEIDTFPSSHAKRPRPRLDFDKVLLSKTNYCEDDESESNSKRVSYFAPIVGSDSEDNDHI